MTDARPKQIQDIETLLAERRKYEQWLAQLEGRKESTPSHVYVKVHRDYTARLAEAQAKLSSESGGVNALATELEAALAAQEKQIAERTDERAEAELRASVGEFAGKEWDKLRGKLDSAIADLSGERDALVRELETLRTLLSDAAPSTNGAAAPGDVDDIAFLRSVLGRSTPYSTTPPPVETPVVERPAARASTHAEKRPSGQTAAPAEPAPPHRLPAAAPPSAGNGAPPAHAPARASSAAPPAPRASVPVAGPPPEPQAPAEPAPKREAAPPRPSAATARPSASAASVAAAQEAMPELFSNPAEIEEPSSAPRGTDDTRPHRPSETFGRLTPRTTEAVKSLKCQECGTLNFPTEWYCERCGGELAAF